MPIGLTILLTTAAALGAIGLVALVSLIATDVEAAIADHRRRPGRRRGFQVVIPLAAPADVSAPEHP